jgi:hypothetical protein
MRDERNKKVSLTLLFHRFFLLSFIFLFPMLALGQMESSQYKIQFDSVNSGGGLSSSPSYGIQDTIGEVVSGESQSEQFKMFAGYQYMNTTFISISDASNINLGSMSGLLANHTEGTTSWTVLTDSSSGYILQINATGTPALRDPVTNVSFQDYIPSSSNPDFGIIVPSGSSVFAFSPTGTDLAQAYRHNGSTCAIGLNVSGGCWNGFGTSTKTISSRTTSNHTGGGSVTSLTVRAANGSNHIQPAGAYQAVIVVTALSL